MSSSTYLLAGQTSELGRLQLQSRVWEPSGTLSCTSYASSATARVDSVVPSAWLSTVPRYHPSGGDHSPPSLASLKPSMSTTGHRPAAAPSPRPPSCPSRDTPWSHRLAPQPPPARRRRWSRHLGRPACRRLTTTGPLGGGVGCVGCGLTCCRRARTPDRQRCPRRPRPTPHTPIGTGSARLLGEMTVSRVKQAAEPAPESREQRLGATDDG